MKERRAFPRHNTHTKAHYLYVRGMVALEEDTCLENLSLGGMCLRVSSVIKKGDVFLVEMKMPFIATISTMVKVMWVENNGSSTRAGVAFEWVSNINKLTEYIEELQLKAA